VSAYQLLEKDPTTLNSAVGRGNVWKTRTLELGAKCHLRIGDSMGSDNELLNKFMDILRNNDHFTIYVEGTEIFVSKSKDGFILGYADNELRSAPDDHVTLVLAKESPRIEKIHRTVDDTEERRYIDIDPSIVTSEKSLIQYLKDLNSSSAPLSQKWVLVMMYYLLRWGYGVGGRQENVEIPDEARAKELGLRYPAVIIKKLNRTERLVLSRVLGITKSMNEKQLLKKGGEQNIPGYRVRINKKVT